MRSIMYGRHVWACVRLSSIFFFHLTSVHAPHLYVGRVSRIVRFFHCFDERACVHLYCWTCVVHRLCGSRACDPCQDVRATLQFFLTSVHASNYIVGRVSRIVPAGDVRAFHVWTCVRLSSTFFSFIGSRKLWPFFWGGLLMFQDYL